MGHIFISYSHKDSSYVHKLVDALEEEGFEVWIDDRIHYGSEWPKVVTSNLDISDGVIVVLSNNSYDSDMVQNEVARARDEKKPIFPLLLEGKNWLIVQAKQFVDVRDESVPTEKFYKRLEEITQRKDKKAEREAAERIAQEKVVRKQARKDAEEKARLETEEQARSKAVREKAESDLIEKVARGDFASDDVLREAEEKALRESMPRENVAIDRLIESRRETTEKTSREKAEAQPNHDQMQLSPLFNPQVVTAKLEKSSWDIDFSLSRGNTPLLFLFAYMILMGIYYLEYAFFASDSMSRVLNILSGIAGILAGLSFLVKKEIPKNLEFVMLVVSLILYGTQSFLFGRPYLLYLSANFPLFWISVIPAAMTAFLLFIHKEMLGKFGLTLSISSIVVWQLFLILRSDGVIVLLVSSFLAFVAAIMLFRNK